MDKDDNKFDLDIKAILESGQEEVPAHIWDNLEPRLEIMAEERRKMLFLRWMRYTTAVAAAAAVIAIAIVFPWGADIAVPEDIHNGIAVIEKPVQDTAPEDRYIALAADGTDTGTANGISGKSSVKSDIVPSEIPSSIDNTFNAVSVETETVKEAPEETDVEETEPEAMAQEPVAGPEKTVSESILTEHFDESGADATRKDRIKTSITMSGNALSNSRTKGAKSNLFDMKAPAMQRKNSIKEQTESTYGIPLSFGIGARIEFTRRWSISAGVNYTMLSRNFKGIYINNDGIPTPDISIVNTQSYIGIPVNVYFNIVSGSFVDFYAYAGGTMEKCIENKFLLKEAAPDVIRKKAAGLQWSANIGLGAEFIITDWLGLYIDPSLRYYFKSNQPKSIRTQQPLSMGFELGFRVRL